MGPGDRIHAEIPELVGSVGRAVPGEAQFRLDGEPPASGSNRDAHRRRGVLEVVLLVFGGAEGGAHLDRGLRTGRRGGTKDDEQDQAMAFHAVKGANAGPIGSTVEINRRSG